MSGRRASTPRGERTGEDIASNLPEVMNNPGVKARDWPSGISASSACHLIRISIIIIASPLILTGKQNA